MAIQINAARAIDATDLHAMVLDLATYESAAHEVRTTAADYEQSLSAEHPPFSALIARDQETPAGFGLYYNRYSTWEGPSIHIEDLYVAQSHRGRGIGRMLIGAIAQKAQEQGATRIDLEVLAWNERAESLYRELGAVVRDDWKQMRFGERAIRELTQS